MTFDPPPPLESPPQWQWPRQLPGADTQRIVDVNFICSLEQAPAPLQNSFQGKLLTRLIAFAAQASPHWREWLSRADMASLQVGGTGSLPVMDRASLRTMVEANGPLPLPRAHGATMPHATSGSTGMPMSFFISEFALRVVRHHYAADHVRHGRNLLHKRAALGSRIEPHPGREHVFAQGNPWLLESHIYTRRNIDFSMREHAAWLAQLAPAYLACNPAMLSGILEIYESGMAPAGGMQQLMTFGATVEPDLRERTRRVLGASIRDRYSCEEIGPIALQCPHDTSDDPPYHVCVANAIVEVVDASGKACAPGQPGRVLVTGLHHWASPAIRYDIGDVACMRPQCSCGVQVPALFNLLGRKTALLRTPSGQARFVRLTANDWLGIAMVREYRLLQQTRQTVRVELVTATALSITQRTAIRAMLGERISPEFTWDLHELPAIDWPPGDKRQDVVCLLQ